MPKREKQGVIVSDKCDKTVVVQVSEYTPHKKYKKIIETTKKYMAHDEQNQCKKGDIVRLIESKPLSASKRWSVVEIVESAK